MTDKNKERMSGIIKRMLVITLLLSITSITALAAASGVVLKSKAELEVVVKKPDGTKETKRVDIAKSRVVPGDTIVFTVSYANDGNKPASGVVVKNPVPKYMTYIGESAEGKNTKIEFSVNNGKSYGAPAGLKVPSADGKERAATAADYTNVKWTLTTSLAPGAKGNVSFKAKVK